MKAWTTWWDDALLIAQAEAAFTGVRHRVRAVAGFWLVEAV